MPKRDFFNGVHTGQGIRHDIYNVPGKKGRQIDLEMFSGFIAFADGQMATTSGLSWADLSDGAGPFGGNLLVLLEDGSISRQTFKSKIKVTEGSDRASGKGQWQMVGGTGQFAKLRGGGTFSWTMIGDKFRTEFSGKPA
jgi:hypothetical protein